MGWILIRLVTGASWADIEAVMDFAVSDTTLRARRDDWIDAGVFDQLAAEAITAYDRILELLIIGRLLDYRNRWSPTSRPI